MVCKRCKAHLIISTWGVRYINAKSLSLKAMMKYKSWHFQVCENARIPFSAVSLAKTEFRKSQAFSWLPSKYFPSFVVGCPQNDQVASKRLNRYTEWLNQGETDTVDLKTDAVWGNSTTDVMCLVPIQKSGEIPVRVSGSSLLMCVLHNPLN